jgi:EpsD family peptidyl-prolyl cis-trans isomerase
MRHAKSLLVLSMTVALVAGCGPKKGGEASAVTVNGTAISAAEINKKLEQYSHFPAEQKKSVTGTLLKATVDAELLRQAAVAAKLDQDETVRLKLQQTNRMILANAYVEKVRNDVAKPDAATIKAYYEKHPELFAQRKVYELTELVIQPRPDNSAEILAKLGDGKDFAGFTRWLGERKIANGSREHTAAPDNMPEEIAVKLNTLGVGQAFHINQENALVILRVKGAQPQPISLEQATPGIEKKIREEAMSKVMEETIRKLRDKAKVVYSPPFAAPDAATAKP